MNAGVRLAAALIAAWTGGRATAAEPLRLDALPPNHHFPAWGPTSLLYPLPDSPVLYSWSPRMAVPGPGGRIYLAMGATGVSIVTQERWLGDARSVGDSSALAVNGNLLYSVGPESAHLSVIDIRDPERPAVVGRFPAPALAVDVLLAGNHLYVADLVDGFTVYDASVPAEPVRIGNYVNPGSALWRGARQMVRDGALLYLSGLTEELVIVDVQNPSQPARVGAYGAGREGEGLAIANGFAFLASPESGFSIVDVRSPGAPQRVGNLRLTEDAVFTPEQFVAVGGTHAYVSVVDGRIFAVDVRDPSRPALTAIFAPPVPTSSAPRLTLAGDRLVAVHMSLGVVQYSLQEPGRLVQDGPWIGPSQVADVALTATHALVLSSRSPPWMSAGTTVQGLWIVDRSHAAGPVIQRMLGGDALQRVVDLAASPRRAILAVSSPRGLLVLDPLTSNGTAVEGVFPSEEPPVGLDVVENLAFLATATRLHIVNVENGADPRELSRYASRSSIRAVQAWGDRVCLVCDAAGVFTVEVLDVSDPTQVGLVANLVLGLGPRAAVACADGRFAYVGITAGDERNPGAFLQIMELGDAAIPRVRATIPVPSPITGLHVVDGIAYLGLKDRGLLAVDVRDPVAARVLGGTDALGAFRGIPVLALAMSGHSAYVAAGWAGLGVFHRGSPWPAGVLVSGGSTGDSFTIESSDEVGAGAMWVPSVTTLRTAESQVVHDLDIEGVMSAKRFYRLSVPGAVGAAKASSHHD